MMTGNSNLQVCRLNFGHVSHSKLETGSTSVSEVKLPGADKGPLDVTENTCSD